MKQSKSLSNFTASPFHCQPFLSSVKFCHKVLTNCRICQARWTAASATRCNATCAPLLHYGACLCRWPCKRAKGIDCADCANCDVFWDFEMSNCFGLVPWACPVNQNVKLSIFAEAIHMCSPVFCPEFWLQFPLLQVFVPHVALPTSSSEDSWNKMKQTGWENVADSQTNLREDFEKREDKSAKLIVCRRSQYQSILQYFWCVLDLDVSIFGALVHIFGEFLRLPFPHRDVFLDILIGLFSLAQLK